MNCVYVRIYVSALRQVHAALESLSTSLSVESKWYGSARPGGMSRSQNLNGRECLVGSSLSVAKARPRSCHLRSRLFR